MDPVTVRELTGLSRRAHVYLGRGLHVGIVGFAIYLWWSLQLSPGRLLSPSGFANLGRQLFSSLVVLQAILVTFGAALGASDSIVREIRSGTLALLFLTPLSGVQIAFAKWKAALAQALSLMLCGIPAIAVCSYLGAIGLWEIAWSTSLTFALAALGAALGLRQSLFSKSAGRAAFMALLQLAAPVFLLLPVAAFVPPVNVFLTYLHPIGAVHGILNLASLGGPGEFAWISATVVSVAFSILIVLWTGTRLHERSLRIEDPNPDLTEDCGLLVAGAAVRSWVTETRVWDEEPLLWKELATRPGVRTENYLGKPLVWASFVGLVLMWLGTGGVSTPFLLAVEFLVLIAVVVFGSGLFVRDRETRWSELIHCSPISTFQLLRAKLMSGVIAPESRYVLAVGAAVLLGWTVPLGFLPALFAALAATLFMGFAYLVGALSSLHSGTIRRAFLCAAAVLATILIAFPGESVWSGTRTFFGRAPVPAFDGYLTTLNPVVFLCESGQGPWDSVRAERPSIALVCFVASYGAASVLVLASIGWSLHRARCRP